MMKPEHLAARLDADPEFLLAARHWTGLLRLGFRRTKWQLELRDGRAVGCREGDGECGPGDVEIASTEDGWRKLLAPVPEPFHHDVVAASIHEDFSIGGDIETFYAYYLAVRRVIAVMRELEPGR